MYPSVSLFESSEVEVRLIDLHVRRTQYELLRVIIKFLQLKTVTEAAAQNEIHADPSHHLTFH